MKYDLRYQALFDRSNDAIFLVDFDQVIQAVNQKTTELLGYEQEELIGMTIQDIIAPEESDLSRQRGEEIFAGETPPIYERTFIRKNGTRVVGEISAMVVNGSDGKPEFVQSIVRDVTRRREIEQALLESESRYRSLYEQTNDGITMISFDGTIIESNQRAGDILGYNREELIGQNVDDFLKPEEPERSIHVLDRLRNGEKIPIYERTLVRKDGTFVPVEINISLVKDQDGNPLYLQSITRDISERKRIEKKLEHWSTHDWLTDLPNRFLLYDRLDKSIARGKRYKRKFAVLYIDLDGFKEVNDARGHSTGDLVLIEMSRRLVDCLRESDTIARMGGDEFIMLVEEINTHADALTSAQRVLQQIEKPFIIQGYDIRISASIGISIFPDHGEDDDALVTCADQALYRSKEKGKGSFSVCMDQ